MTNRMRLAATGLLVFVALLGYLVWPLGSSRYSIEWDQESVERKDRFLQEARSSPQPDRRPPNVVLILADDLGKTDISLYRGTVPTPNIDELAAQGVVFSDAYAPSPICSPSRAGLLTGRYQQRFGFETQPMERYPRNRMEFYFFKHFMDLGDWVVREEPEVPLKEDRERQGLPPSEVTIGDLLQAAGYRTAVLGKWHLGHHEDFIPARRGFGFHYGFYGAFSLYSPIGTKGVVEHRHDYFANRHMWKQARNGTASMRRNDRIVEEPDYLTYAITREAQRFILENHADPFFLFVSFNAPHTPFQAPAEYVERFSHVEDENKRVYYAMIAALDDAVGGSPAPWMRWDSGREHSWSSPATTVGLPTLEPPTTLL